MIFAFIVAKILNTLIKAIENGAYIKIVILARLYMLTREAMSMFIFGNFFDIVSIMSYFVLLGLFVLERIGFYNRQTIQNT